MIKRVRDYTRELCESQNNYLSPHFFNELIVMVVDFAKSLGQVLGADLEVIEIATYLHDISAVQDFNTLATHPKDSAQIAERVLQYLQYTQGKIDQVKECILKHATPLSTEQGTLEQVCVSNADAMSQIVNPAYWLYFATT